jgi:hypothetical protein
MAKVLVTAEVKDRAQWEKSFRSHGEMFRSSGVKGTTLVGINENNEVAVLQEIDDPVTAMDNLNTPEYIKAMEADGVKRDTVKTFVLDKEFTF